MGSSEGMPENLEGGERLRLGRGCGGGGGGWFAKPRKWVTSEYKY